MLEQELFSRRELFVAGAGLFIAACGGKETPRPSFSPETIFPKPLPKPLTPEPRRSLSPEEERLARHDRFHYPTVEGKEVPAKPYLTLPFRESDIKGDYDITEGWIYSKEEQAIHGFTEHMGIDIAMPYGTPVISPVDGYAMSSYHTFWVDNGSRLYKKMPVRLGLGYFVQIYVPSVNRFLQLAHLSEIDQAIPFSPAEEQPGIDLSYNPTNHNLPIDQLKGSSAVMQIIKGQSLGKVGFSGLAWGVKYEDEYALGRDGRPIYPDPPIRSWDEPHVHFEEFWRDQSTGEKTARRDPFGIYSTAEDYPTPYRRGVQGIDPLFLMQGNNLPQFSG